MMSIGGKAKVEKNAVAPAKRRGSFLFSSLNDKRIHFKIRLRSGLSGEFDAGKFGTQVTVNLLFKI